MKITCTQSDLDNALRIVSRCVSSRPTHPVLSNILFVANADQSTISLTGFDLNLGIRTTIPAAVAQSGAITIPARLLSEIVSLLSPSTPITIDCKDGDGNISLTSNSGSYQMRGISADDFPDLPITQSGKPIQIDAQAFINGIRNTIFASSTDESKQLLAGVHLAISPDGIECAATDGHRLAILSFDDALTDGTPFNITIPSRSLREVERVLSSRQSSEPVSIFTNNGQLVFLYGDQIVTSRSLDGTYPNYRQLIPSSFSRTITIDRRGFIAALDRVAVLADQHNNVIKLVTKSGSSQLQVQADAKDVGNGSELLAAEITGDDIDIAFNVRYILDGIKSISADQITIHCNTPSTPAILMPADQAGHHAFTYLAMPIQVRA